MDGARRLSRRSSTGRLETATARARPGSARRSCSTGIAERRPYSKHPERFEYRLTEKGRELQPVMLAFLCWGDAHKRGPSGPPLETVHTQCDHVFHMVPTCSHCGGS